VPPIGQHIVKTAHGLWLPGDARGHWSTAWDEQIGLIEPHMLHEGDPVRERMAAERMKHNPVRFTPEMIEAIIETIAECASNSPWNVAAVSCEPTHLHLLMTYSKLNIHRTMKWMTSRMTRAVHRRTDHEGPVWAKGKWCSFIYDESWWSNAMQYIERHNLRRGLPARPYDFIQPGS